MRMATTTPIAAFRPLLLAALACFASMAWAGIDEAMAFYEKQDYANAYDEFVRTAEIGNHLAQFNIGVMYYRGQHVAKNSVQSYAWMKLAGQAGDEKWNDIAAQLYATLDDTEKKQAEEARQALFDRLSDAAVAKGLAPDLAGAGVSQPLLVVKRVPPEYTDEMKRKHLFGWADVMFTVAADGTTRNHTVISATDKLLAAAATKALKGYQYQPMVANGRAVDVYGEQVRFYFYMADVVFSEKKVRKLADEARVKAEKEGGAASYSYANMIEQLPQYTKALQTEPGEFNRWYLRSAQDGYGPAQFALGKNLLYGRACTADAAKSLRWLQSAAEHGQPESQFLLANEMLSGVRLGRNPEMAVKWLQRAAEANRHAQLKLAWVYATSADEKLRNAALAKVYADKVDDDYVDHLTLFETRAAAAAANGDFKSATEWQGKAVAEAERFQLPLQGFNEKLARYQAGAAWIDPA